MVTSDCNEVIRKVMGARTPTDLFGTNEKRAKIRFHRMASVLHPDVNDSPDSETAMRKLSKLWSEYTHGSGGSGKASAKTPREITRNDTYVLFDEGDVLVVERHVSDVTYHEDDLHGMREAFDSEPVCVLESKSSTLIAQPDGTHAAYRCDVPDKVGRDLLMLSALREHLPNGTMHPADMAWISKRLLYLVGIMEVYGVTFDYAPDFSECLAVSPSTHMLVFVAPWELSQHDGWLARREVAIGPYIRCVREVSGNDAKSRRIIRFLEGVALDDFTPMRDILIEYDSMLEDLFGEPRFHVMECL